MIIYSDSSYWVIDHGDSLSLMHAVYRADIQSQSQVCIGEALPDSNGHWNVTIWIRNNPHFIGNCSSRSRALEVLWNYRNHVHWGYLQ